MKYLQIHVVSNTFICLKRPVFLISTKKKWRHCGESVKIEPTRTFIDVVKLEAVSWDPYASNHCHWLAHAKGTWNHFYLKHIWKFWHIRSLGMVKMLSFQGPNLASFGQASNNSLFTNLVRNVGFLVTILGRLCGKRYLSKLLNR